MNRRFLTASLAALLSLTACPLWAHGPAHRHGPVAWGDHSDHEDCEDHPHRSWGLSLETGWESRHVHYGVDETGRDGAWQTELTLWADRFIFQFWNGVGIGNGFEKYELSLAWQGEAGPLFVVPGYRFRYQPGMVEHGHHHGSSTSVDAHDSHGSHHGHGHAHHEDDDDHAGEETGASHQHKRYGHELFVSVGTRVIPYVTPSITAVCDLYNTPGTYVEARLDGELPLIGKRLVAEPYALVGLNFGYSTRDTYGWSHFQTGGQLRWNLHERVALYGGVHYRVALDVVHAIGQGNEVWVNTGLSFSY